MESTFAVYCGLDVGKGAHHAVALDPSGRRLHDGTLPQDEARLRALFTDLGRHGPVLLVVDQPATIGALPIAVARAVGVAVAYLPGLAMRRIADLHPGSAKTDARDAYVIADAARTLPQTLRRVDAGEEVLAELGVLVGYDDDRTQEATRLSNRMRGLLTQVHPAAERVIGPKVTTGVVLELLARFGGPAGWRAAGKRRLLAVARTAAPRSGEQLVTDLLTALEEQTVTVLGAGAAEKVLPRLAESLRAVLDQRKAIAAEVEEILDAHPLAPVLTSMPGVGVRIAARSCSKSVTPPPSPPPGTWLPTPAWHLSPAARGPPSAGNTHPAEATSNSSGPCSSPRSPPWPTLPHGPTATANAPPARSTTPHSSASPAAASTSCTP